MASPLSFQGLSTNLQTDKLVDAIMSAEEAPLQRMQDRQALNSKRASLVRTFQANLLALRTTFGNLANTSFQSRSVTSSDANGTYVSATASGGVSGSYDVVVSQVATKARLTAPTGLATLSTSLGGTDTVGDGSGTYDYTLRNADGTSTTFSLSAASNTLAGLRDAINAKSGETGVSATVVQTAAAGNSYKLVLSATETGKGSAALNPDSIYLKGNTGNALGLSATGSGTQSQDLAKNALFSVNGLALERTSNTVSDAVEGVTFTLKSGDPAKTTTLTVGTDRSGLTTAMNELVAKFNALYKTYKDNSGTGGALAGDTTLRTILGQVRGYLTSPPSELSSGAAYRSGAELGLKTNRDGTMGFDATTFQEALDADPSAVEAVFAAANTAFQTYATQVTSPGSGNLAMVLQTIDSQNLRLASQISTTQVRLDRRSEALMAQFANLESVVGQLQAAGQSLGSLT